MLYDQAFLSKDQDELIVAQDELIVAQDDGHVYSYPAAVNIKNAVGREMMVTLLARSGTHIQFTRPDGEEFVYPISSLDLAAQTLISKYPNDGIKNAVAHVDQESLETIDNKTLADHHVTGMYKARMDLREELRLLKNYHLPAAETKSEKNTVIKDIKAIELKIRKVELKIAEHQSYLKR
jgi:hypothetical protein